MEEHKGHHEEARNTGNDRVWLRSVPYANPFARKPLGIKIEVLFGVPSHSREC